MLAKHQSLGPLGGIVCNLDTKAGITKFASNFDESKLALRQCGHRQQQKTENSAG